MASPSTPTAKGAPAPRRCRSRRRDHSPAEPGARRRPQPLHAQLARGEGQQYLSKVQTTLPPGLLGAIPSVTLCAEAPANAGTCPATSEVGTVAVSAGAGSEPYTFTGHAFLTGPYGGAPYGLSIVVPAAAGPYDFGEVITRASIGVGLYSGSRGRHQHAADDRRRRAAATAEPERLGQPPRLPVQPDRLRPACHRIAAQRLRPRLQRPHRTGRFEPLPGGRMQQARVHPEAHRLHRRARLAGRTGPASKSRSRRPPARPNIHEVLTSLPKKLAARITTLHKACPAATFEAGPPPGGCSKEARVGSATVTTPCLPGALTGPAYLVSHGSEAYPDLDIVLTGDGVEVVLVGHTHIAPRDSLLLVRIAARRADLELRAEPPQSPQLGADRQPQRQPLWLAPDDAHDDRRAERGADHAEHEDRRPRLPAQEAQAQAPPASTPGPPPPSAWGTEAPRRGPSVRYLPARTITSKQLSPILRARDGGAGGAITETTRRRLRCI